MAEKYEYQQHPHAATRQHRATDSHLAGVNARLGLWVTKRVGTMWAAYVFAALALLSLPAALDTGDIRVIVDWVAQTFLQLVLVSVILVGQNQQSQQAEIRAEATYQDATALLHEFQQLQKHLHHQDQVIAQLRDELGKKAAK